MTPRHMRLSIEDVIRPSLVTSEQAAEILGIAAKTWHNKVAAGEIPFEPVGQLVVSGKLSFTIWKRAEVEQLQGVRKGATITFNQIHVQPAEPQVVFVPVDRGGGGMRA